MNNKLIFWLVVLFLLIFPMAEAEWSRPPSVSTTIIQIINSTLWNLTNYVLFPRLPQMALRSLHYQKHFHMQA